MNSNVFLLLGDLTPFVRRFVLEMDGAPVSGVQKRDAVLDLVGTIYEGARRTGALTGVKEVKDVPWASLAPLVGMLIDAICTIWTRVGFRSPAPPAIGKP